MEDFKTYSNRFDYIPDIRDWDGKKCFVIPVVMMVEGVHNGSHGPVFHSAEELGKIVEAWNGIPVTVGHPTNGEGSFISANSPNVLTEWAVGKVFNSQMDGTKLKAEVWIEADRLVVVSETAFNEIQSGHVMEVSVGVFSDEEETEGEWNGEKYKAIARNHRPDHLALLPGEVGACSVNDGCGLRVNLKGGKRT
jgi:hypothetical protein